jgi:hypothetical protein
MVVDRTSWVTSAGDKTSVIYRLDTQLLIPLYVFRKSKIDFFFVLNVILGIQWVELVFVVVVH